MKPILALLAVLIAGSVHCSLEIPCPLPQFTDVVCNAASGNPCFCLTADARKAKFICSEDPFRNTQYARVDFKQTSSSKNDNNLTTNALMAKLESKLLQVFNENRIKPQKRQRKTTIPRLMAHDIRILRLQCDDTFPTLWIGFDATAKNVQFNATGIEGTSLLDVDRVIAVEESDVPYMETEFMTDVLYYTNVNKEVESDYSRLFGLAIVGFVFLVICAALLYIYKRL